MDRVFLDWQEPILKSASRYIIKKYTQNNVLNLKNVFIVTAGAKPYKRLLEILLIESEKEELSFIPPQTLTPKSLISSFIVSSKKNLTDFQSLLFFIKALQNKKDLVENDFLKKDYQKGNLSSYISLAKTIYKLYEEISVSNISFKDVAAKTKELEAFEDDDRWNNLQEIYEEYERLLELFNVTDTYIERRKLLISNHHIANCQDLIFVNIPYFNPIFCDILRKIECKKTFLIFAPEDKKEYFDDLGTLVFNKWLNEKVIIDDDSIVIANDIKSLGNSVKNIMIDLSGDYSAKDIIIGTTDDSLILPIKKEVMKEGISIASVREKNLSNSSLYKLIDLLKSYVETSTFENFANFIRHPDILHYLNLKDDTLTFDLILSMLDEYSSLHLPYYFKENSIVSGMGDTQDRKVIECIKKIFIIVSPFFKMNQKEDTISVFTDFILNMIVEIYKNLELSKSKNEDKIFIEVFEGYRKVLISLSENVDNLEIKFSFSQVLSLLNSLALDISIGAISYTETVEIQGWLEVQNDDSEAVILVGLSEGKWPESISQDEFLPNSLRTLLGIMDNDKRYVRDLFMLQSIIASKKKVFFVPLKTNADSSENLMSKLLLTQDAKTNAKRIINFYNAENSFSENIENKNEDINFLLEPKIESYNLEKISVSEFKEYHECPYRYYLKHVLNLSSVEISLNELNPLMSGNIFHELFYRFGISDLKNSEDKKEIEQFLFKELEKYVSENFGNDYLPTINVQLEGIKKILSYFSSWQSAWHYNGWKIFKVEESFNNFYLRVNDIPVKVVGRIDRIDYNEKEGLYRIFDYKTGSSKYDLQRVYGPKKGWIDWQMPLYVNFLLQEFGFEKISCAYLNVSSFNDAKYCGDEVLIKDEEALLDALKSAKEIISNIQHAIFWPPKNINSPYDIFNDLF